jgi:hypothetical protein
MLILGPAWGSKAQAVTCRSDRITYISDDRQREFRVTETRRGTTRVAQGGGILTQEFLVMQGRVGARVFYVYDERVLSNTGRSGTGTMRRTRVVERLSDSRLSNLKPQSWPVYFQQGSMAFHIYGSSAPDDMAGLWLYGTCRDRE